MNNGENEVRTRTITSNSETRRDEISAQNEERNCLLTKFRAVIAFLTVEPFLLCYVFCNSLSSIAVDKLKLEKACRADLGNSKVECDKRDENITIAIQTMVADLQTWQLPLESSVPAILILFIASWSDRTRNRKALMLIPMFAEFVSSFGLVLTTFYFDEWPLFITGLIESLPRAVTGGIIVGLMGSHAYLSDVTSLESRTVRIGIAAMILISGEPVAILIGEGLLDTIGFYGVFGVVMFLHFLGLMYTYFMLHDVNLINVDKMWCHKLTNFLNPNNPWDTISLAIKRSPNRMKVILVIAVHVVVVGPLIGQESLEDSYIILKYKMKGYEITLYFFCTILLSVCGIAIAMVLFCKYMKLQDASVGIIATTGTILASIVYALAPTKYWYYCGCFVDLFYETGLVAVRSLGTKVAGPNAVARMCALVALMDTITPMIYIPLYNKINDSTKDNFPGAFYLAGVALTAPAYLIFICLYLVYKKEERDIVTNPERKEIHVHENDVSD